MSNELQQDRVVEVGVPYKRTHWRNNETPLNAANLNNIENGIQENTQLIANEKREREAADIAINAELDAVEKKTGLVYPTEAEDGTKQTKAGFSVDLQKDVKQQLGDDPSLLDALNAESLIRKTTLDTETKERKAEDEKINKRIDDTNTNLNTETKERQATDVKSGVIYDKTNEKATFDLANCFTADDLKDYPELVEIEQQFLHDKDPSLLTMLLNEIYRRVKADEKLGVTTTVDLDNVTGSASFNQTFKDYVSEADGSDTFLSQVLNNNEATLGDIICIILMRMYASLSKCGIYLDTSDEEQGFTFTYDINEVKTAVKRNDSTNEVWNYYSSVLNSLNSFNIMQLFATLLREVYYDDKDSKSRDTNLQNLINDINGDTAATSVNKKITDAFNAFATNLSNDNIVNTYKELIDYVAEHGGEFAELVGLVDSIEKNYATKEELEEVASKVSENIDISNLISYGTEDPDENINTQYYVKLNDTEVIIKNEEQGTIDVKVVVNGTTYSSSAEYYREGDLVYVTGSVPDTDTGTLIKTFTSLVNLYFETTNDNFYKPVLNTDLKVVDTGSYSVIYNTNGVISKKDLTAPTLPDGGSFSFQFITKDPFYK